MILLFLLYLTVYGIPEDVFLESSVFSQNITEVKLCTKTRSGCEIRANLLLSFFLFVFSWGTSCRLVLGLVGGWAFHEHHRSSAHELESFLVLFWIVLSKCFWSL
jgi:hypothetical protein